MTLPATIHEAEHVHLTGIKGVAMTALAECLKDMGKTVTGSDVEESFVTQPTLDRLNITVSSFSPNLSATSSLPDLLIYTAAHHGPNNPEVLFARSSGIPVLSHAEALGQLFNEKKGVAVCGVGGKSTTSAMIAWTANQAGKDPSYAVGVGNIIGLNRSGAYVKDSEWFIAEADEYVIDPKAENKVPRFSYLLPEILVCTSIAFDHPDVYSSFKETQKVFLDFFHHIQPHGTLIYCGDQPELEELISVFREDRSDIRFISYGLNASNTVILSQIVQGEAHISGQIVWNDMKTQLMLRIPGTYNLLNATAAMIASSLVIGSLEQNIDHLRTFQSTKRRFEFIGEKKGVNYYDDYAHHPREIRAVIEALYTWYPAARKVVAFQPHTFSRTKQLFLEFVESFSQANEIILLDIFASARESFDDSVSSDQLAQAIQEKFPDKKIQNLHTLDQLAQYCTQELHQDDVLITLGAGDIYHLHDMIQ